MKKFTFIACMLFTSTAIAGDPAAPSGPDPEVIESVMKIANSVDPEGDVSEIEATIAEAIDLAAGYDLHCVQHLPVWGGGFGCTLSYPGGMCGFGCSPGHGCHAWCHDGV